MNMKSVFFFVTITLAIQVFANLPQLPFSEESAKKFITTNPNLKEVSSQLCSKAFDLYATKDLPMASTTKILTAITIILAWEWMVSVWIR